MGRANGELVGETLPSFFPEVAESYQVVAVRGCREEKVGILAVNRPTIIISIVEMEEGQLSPLDLSLRRQDINLVDLEVGRMVLGASFPATPAAFPGGLAPEKSRRSVERPLRAEPVLVH